MTTKDITVVPAYFTTYTNKVPDDLHLLEALERYGPSFLTAQKDKYEAIGDKVYAPGKWTIKQTLIHLIDAERIFAYRALRFARGDQSALMGFEQDDYVANASVGHRKLDDILDEYTAVRHSTITLFASLEDSQLQLSGPASGMPVSVLALGFMMCGHMIHHQEIFEEKYYPLV